MAESPYDVEGLPGIRAGVARRVITPEGEIKLRGYYHERIGKYVRDDLHCRALVFETRHGRLALVTLDLIGVAAEWVQAAKQDIQRRTGIPPEHVLICATHTHTGPEVRSAGDDADLGAWLARLPQVIAETAEAAAEDMFDALIFVGRQEEQYLASNRLGRTREGTEVFSKEGVIDHAGPVDPELLAMSVREYDGTVRAMVVNYAMHVDVVGGETADFVSADWPGEMARAVAGVYGDQVVTLFVNGTCGDINHRLWHETRQPAEGEHKAIQMGRALAGLAINATEKAEPLEGDECAAALRVLEIPYYTREAKFMAEIEELRQRNDLEYFERATIRSVDRWDRDGQMAQAPVQVMRLGELVFAGLPGEVFVRWGLEMKRWSPGRHTFVIELANDALGYIPTTDQAERGGYGAKPILSRRLIADAGRQMADAVQVMMWESLGEWAGDRKQSQGDGG
jgi:neutral ceramidase